MNKILFLFFTLLVNVPIFGQIQPIAERKNIPIPVLCYHHVTDQDKQGFNVKVADFEKQMEFLKTNGYIPVGLDQFMEFYKKGTPKDFPGKPVVISFDDGGRSVYEFAYPILKKYNFKSVLFLYPTIISNPKHKAYLKWEELKFLVKTGLFDIASHSLYHPRLVELSESELKEQLVKSRSELNEKLGVKVKDIAFPFGLYDERVFRLMQEAGYRSGFTINPGLNSPITHPYRLHRFLIRTSDSLKTFAGYLEYPTFERYSIFPENGSIIKEGDSFKITFPGETPKNLQVKINGKEIKLHYTGSALTGIFPKLVSRKIMTMILKESSEKKNKTSQLLYIVKR